MERPEYFLGYNTLRSRRCRKTVRLKDLFPGQHLTVIYIHLLEFARAHVSAPRVP